MPTVVHQVTANNYARILIKELQKHKVGKNKLLTNFNCPIKTTSVWCKQGVLECFEVASWLYHTSCTLSGLRPTATISPRQAPNTPKSRKSDASHLGNKTTKHNSIKRRHITAVNTRTHDLRNELEYKLTLNAAGAVESAAVFT